MACLRLIPIGFLAVLLSSACAEGQVDPWEFEVLPYATEQRGTIELESNNAIVANGHSRGGNGTAVGAFRSQRMWYNADELTYGVTDRIEAAGYVTFAQPAGHGFWWAGNKVHLRGMLFKHARLPVDLGWYTALEWHKTPQFDNADLILELKPIIERDWGSLSLVVNPVFEKVLLGNGHDQGFAFGYRNGLYFKWTEWLSPGLEFYGGVGLIDDNDPLNRQQHYILPVIQGELLEGLEYSVGPGFGLTRGSDHVIIKFNLAMEKFVGAIFGPSTKPHWFE
ncbi:MAG: hypothetical protein JO166_22985 [Deltaproteobacteria bacterium]|nr:hypothetical protein [Deltaproteobacteria bacterium]